MKKLAFEPDAFNQLEDWGKKKYIYSFQRKNKNFYSASIYPKTAYSISWR